MVSKIAESDPLNTIGLDVESVTKGGSRLQLLWEEGKATQAIQKGGWKYVVLQEESFWALFDVLLESGPSLA